MYVFWRINNEYFLYFRHYHSCAVYQSARHENRPVVAVTADFATSSTTRIVEILDYTTENPEWTLRKYLIIDLLKSENYAIIYAFQHCTLLRKIPNWTIILVYQIIHQFECKARIVNLKIWNCF